MAKAIRVLLLVTYRFCMLCGHATFLSLNKKVTKEVSQRGASGKCAPFGNPSRNASRCPKMSRFLNTYIEKAKGFLSVDS